MHRFSPYAFAAISSLVCNSAQAAVSPEESARLGSELTLWGAERKGSANGMIPAYESSPEVSSEGFLQEKPLFSINATNAHTYADKLSPGTMAMLERYSDYRLDIYPSRRTIDYPTYVLDNTRRNATSCQTTSNGLQLEGCHGGLPFPIPKTGNEVMWNHAVRYQAYAWQGILRNYFVHGSGLRVLQSEIRTFQQSPFYDPGHTEPAATNDIYYLVRTDYMAPMRRVGEKLVLRDSLNMLDNGGRKAWQYLPGMRRVKLSPGLAYDTPNPHTAGTSVMDESQLFHGSLDRYEFRLIGKRDLYIPYNNYLFNDGTACPMEKKLQQHYLHPDCVRWELHRVWVVEGTLKMDKRHSLPKRMLYLDEDAPGAGLADSYDDTGGIAHICLSLSVPLSGTQTMLTESYVTYDMLTSSYSLMGDSTENGGVKISKPLPTRFFSPEALAADGTR